MNIPAQTIKLCHRDRTLGLLGCLERCLQLGAAIERIGALARLDLGVLGDDRETFRLGERPDTCSSSDNLRLIRRFEKGGSGSSVVRV
jgi:hypothetical protein